MIWILLGSLIPAVLCYLVAENLWVAVAYYMVTVITVTMWVRKED